MDRVHHSLGQCGFGLLCKASLAALMIAGGFYALLG